jgi:hypothetical protein
MIWVFVCIIVYREKLTIPHDKPYIIIQGEGMKKTIVEWDDHASTLQSPTFSAGADHIVVKFITFKVRNISFKRVIICRLCECVSNTNSLSYDKIYPIVTSN